MTVLEITKVKKRNNKIVKFNFNSIVQSILNAGKSTGEFDEAVAKRLALKSVSIIKHIATDEIVHVEDIQNIIEEVLLASAYKKTAKAFILYRDLQKRTHEIMSQWNTKLVDQYLKKKDWKVNENSNMAYSLQGLNNYIASEISKTYWLNSIYPEHIREAHKHGEMHIHDLNMLSVYCVGWDLHDLLMRGFGGVSGKIESTPPKHLRTALGQMVNFLYTLQGEAAGAQAFSHVDTLLAPFIAYENLNESQIRQAIQEFLFNVNVPTRVGFQQPFSNITLDLVVPKSLENEPVIIGGKPLNRTYKEFQNEMNVFNKIFAELMLEGDAKGRVFTFPIPTYNITKEFPWDAPWLDPLWKMTAKYGIPYFANFVNTDMDVEDVRSMCCRLRIDNRSIRAKNGGLFGAAPLTGSIGVVTINLPRLGLISKTESELFQNLDRILNIAKESLEIKRSVLEQLTKDGLYPYTKVYLSHIYARHKLYWKNHFSTIGIIGMNEMLLNMFGYGIQDDRGKQFAIKVLNYMRNKLEVYHKETGSLFNLEATPAEGTSYRLALMDKELYPQAHFANTEAVRTNHAEPYYTNSTQLPVTVTADPIQILEHQNDLQILYTGGTVQHIFLGEQIHDVRALKIFLKSVFSRFAVPYISVTPTFSICQNCGYIPGEKPQCPKCSSETEVYSRIVGYLRPVKQWNKGKLAEFKDRKVGKI